MNQDMRTSEVLNRAADLIERDGWTQGQYGAPEVGYCVFGACNKASTGSASVFEDHAGTAMSLYLGTVPSFWNDAPDRTREQVIEALRACAVIEAAKEQAAALEQVPA